MKITTQLATLSLSLLLAAAPALRAADTTAAPKPDKPAREHGPRGERGPNLDRLAERLGLTADQKAKLGPVLKQQAEQMKALHDDTSLSKDAKMAKARALREEGKKAVDAILTPEQAKKFAEMREHGPRGDRPGKHDKHDKDEKDEAPEGK